MSPFWVEKETSEIIPKFPVWEIGEGSDSRWKGAHEAGEGARGSGVGGWRVEWEFEVHFIPTESDVKGAFVLKR